MTDNYYSKLEMTADKNAGSFVRNLQGRTGTGFAEGTHVHKDWWATTIGYDAALEQTENARREREDIVTERANIGVTVNEDGDFAIVANGREFVPTDHALQQMSIRLKVPSSSVLRELRNSNSFDFADAETMVKLARNSLRRVEPEKKFRLRTYTDGTCRAFVSDRYAPVDNRWYLETLREFLPDGRLSHWRSDEDTLYGNVLLPDSVLDYGDGDSDYGAMLSISNCEIGKRTISQRPSLFRSICLNGCIWGQVSGRNVRRRHVGNINLEVLKLEIARNIELQLPLIPDGIRKFLELKQFETGNTSMDRMLAAVCLDNKIKSTYAAEIRDQWTQYEAADKNLFGVVNAITRAGQLFSNEGWVTCDELGGSLLATNASKWTSLRSRADNLSELELTKVFGSAV